MATGCEEKLTGDILKDCDNVPKAGIEVDVVIINFDDVDKAISTVNATNDILLDNLACVSSTGGFTLEGIKQVNGASFELVKKEDNFDMYRHLFSGVILNPSAENKKLLDEMSSGGRYVVVVEKKWKGAADADAFEVLGFDSGLEIATSVWNSKESDGVIKFELASADGYEEPRMTRTLLETDYATTKTSFTNKFATA